MIDKSNIDFEYSISKINEPIQSDIFLQEDILDSEKINKTFDTIEYNLNKLYENTRFLEDAIDYCEAFLNLKIQDYSLEIKNILKSIEDIRDINKNQGYIEYLIPFIDDASSKKDRDASLISDVHNNNGYLMLNTKSQKDIIPTNISKKSSYVAYNENINNLLEGKQYSACYIEEAIANKGITETITITLAQPTRINYAFIDPINCDIENFRLVYANGVEDYIEYKNGFFNEAIVSQIKFDINTKKYNTSKYWAYKDKDLEDVWNKVKDFEYKVSLNPSTKLEMEEILARTYTDETNMIFKEIYNNNINTSKQIIEKTMYRYIFGINSIKIQYVEQENDSCFVSQSINVGNVKQNEYIQLHVKDNVKENACIEYYLLDGDIEIPIAPAGTTIIKNEKLFSSLPLRFNPIRDTDIAIKKDGLLTDISLDDAKNQMLSRFSADYVSAFKYNYTPINSNLRVKVIIRKFTKQMDTSYVDLIKIRKYGGEALWTNM